MKLNIKNYKLLKTKKIFKRASFFLLYNTATPTNNIKIDQELKKLNLTYYKLHNNLTKQIFKNSIYINYQPLLNGLTILIFPKTPINLKELKKLNGILTLTGVKINNKIYPISNIESLNNLKYDKIYLNLLKTLKTSLKSIKVLS